jgi:hypothetical protein
LRCRGAISLRWHPAAAGVELAFLDGPGGSQVPRAVIDAIAEFYATCNVNTHGNFPPSREVDRRMLEARAAVAAFLGASSADTVSFGQNMTTLNFALSAAIGRTLVAGDEVLITQLDHEANRGPWLALEGPRRRSAGGASQGVRRRSIPRTWRPRSRGEPRCSPWAPRRMPWARSTISRSRGA